MKNVVRQNLLRSTFVLGVAVAASSLVLSGCGSATRESQANEYLLSAEPSGAMDVLALRADAKDQQDVVVIGRIGGRLDPWIKGTAAFPIVDRSLRACSEIEGDTCPTPWDFCCESNLPAATVLVKLVDETGKTIKQDPRTLLDVKELQTVVVQGKVRRDKDGNITVLASHLHVRPDQQTKQ